MLAAVVLSVVAFVFAPGAPFVAVPVAALVLVGGWLVGYSRKRRGVRGIRELRGEAQTADQGANEIRFTDRDKQSLYTG